MARQGRRLTDAKNSSRRQEDVFCVFMVVKEVEEAARFSWLQKP